MQFLHCEKFEHAAPLLRRNEQLQCVCFSCFSSCIRHLLLHLLLLLLLHFSPKLPFPSARTEHTHLCAIRTTVQPQGHGVPEFPNTTTTPPAPSNFRNLEIYAAFLLHFSAVKMLQNATGIPQPSVPTSAIFYLASHIYTYIFFFPACLRLLNSHFV